MIIARIIASRGSSAGLYLSYFKSQMQTELKRKKVWAIPMPSLLMRYKPCQAVIAPFELVTSTCFILYIHLLILGLGLVHDAQFSTLLQQQPTTDLQYIEAFGHKSASAIYIELFICLNANALCVITTYHNVTTIRRLQIFVCGYSRS